MEADRKMTRRLGIYLFVIAWHQIVFYLIWVSGSGPDWLFLFDPRLGALLFESTLLDVEAGTPGVLCWIFAVTLLVVASIMIVVRRGLKLYLAAESLFSVPTIFAFAWVVITRFGSPEGFPLILVVAPIAVFLVFSVLPYGVAVRILAGSPADLSILPSRVVTKTERTQT
jgi:hypothetical protein